MFPGTKAREGNERHDSAASSCQSVVAGKEHLLIEDFCNCVIVLPLLPDDLSSRS